MKLAVNIKRADTYICGGVGSCWNRPLVGLHWQGSSRVRRDFHSLVARPTSPLVDGEPLIGHERTPLWVLMDWVLSRVGPTFSNQCDGSNCLAPRTPLCGTGSPGLAPVVVRGLGLSTGSPGAIGLEQLRCNDFRPSDGLECTLSEACRACRKLTYGTHYPSKAARLGLVEAPLSRKSRRSARRKLVGSSARCWSPSGGWCRPNAETKTLQIA